MASEEQINNQSRFNDLQRDSKELLSDYQQGIRESSEFVSVLTTRSSQLVDVLKDTVSEKTKSTQADKDLISSITKINSLAKGFATPYTDAGKAIRDSNKALDLHSRLQKDIEVIGNQLGQDRLDQANAYKKAEEEIYNTQKKVDADRKNASSLVLTQADELIEKDRNRIEAARQFANFQQKNASLDIDVINAKVAAEKAAAEAVENSISNQKSAIANQLQSQIQLKEAKSAFLSLGAGSTDEEKAAAQNQIDAAQSQFNLAKESFQIAQQQLDVNKSSLSQKQSAFKDAEKEYVQKQAALKIAEKESQLAQLDAQFALDNAKRHGDQAGIEVAQAALALASNTKILDTERDALELAEERLSVDQRIYLEGQKALGQSQAGVEYLEEETQRVREIIQAQTLWNGSLGAAKDLLKKIGLDNQVISIGLDEGAKAAQEYAETLIKGRQEARGAAARANVELEAASAARMAAEEAYQSLQASGSAEAIEAARKELAAKEDLFRASQEAAIAADKTASQSSSIFNKIKDSVKILGVGIKGTFKGMASELKALTVGAVLVGVFKKGFKLIGGSLVTGFISDLKGKFTEGISYLKEQFFSLNSYIEDAKAGDQLRLQLSQAAADLATDLGVGTDEAEKLTKESEKIGREIGMLPEELAKTTAELNKAFGTTQKFSQDTVKTMGQLTHQFGLTNEEASKFVKFSQLSGKETSDFTLETKTRIQSLKEASNIAISEKEVMQEVAKASSSLQLSSRAQGKNLADAAFYAKKLGLSLAQTEAIGSNLLDFESSIASEMEAELLIGRDLNLDKARQFALNKDIGGVAREIAEQMGSAAAFGDLNVIQQEALAKSIGVSADELGNMLTTQELLAGTGFDDMSQAQKQFKDLLKETGSEELALAKMREGGASAALAEEIRVKSAQEERILQERDIANQQMRMAQEAGKLFEAFLGIKEKVAQIKATLVDQMGPFFDSFAGLIGAGGDAFENKVLPYAKQLGKFMNDVGLRLIDIIKNNGPALSNIFQGVLKLFGAIYDKVGGLVKSLLGVSKIGTDAKSVFGSITDILSNLITKVENIDISALTIKIKGFIQGVKDTFAEVKEGIMKAVDLIQNSALGKFLSGNVGSTSLAIAPLAFKGFEASGLFKRGNSKNLPMFVQDVNGGGMMDMAGSMRGGRTAGIGGGFKKGFKGLMDYAKMSFKGGRAGKVGRARIARAAKGLVTGQGASFVGGAGRGTAQAAGKLGGIAGKLGSLGKGLGKLAAGGGIGAIVGLAAEATLGHFKKKAEAAADSMEEGAEKDKMIRKARALGVAAETAKYAGYGVAIGTMIGGPFGAAIGGAVGAAVGFTKGMADAEKARKRDTSAAGKFAKAQRMAAEKHAKALTNIEVTSAALQAKAAKEGFAKEQEVRLQFAEQLGVSGETAVEKLAQLKNLDIDSTSEAFKSFAQDALNAGNITEEEFAKALKGTISPLDLMEKAAKTSSTNLTKLYNSAIATASALSNELKKSILESAGVDEEVINSQVNAVQALTKTANIQSTELFTQFRDALTAGVFDSEAVDTLRGEDSASKGFQEALIKKFETQGADANQVKLAMELYANQLEAANEDFDLDDAADIAKAMEGVGNSLVEVLQSPVLLAEANAAAKESTALTDLDESGILKTIGNLTKDQLSTNEELKSVLESVGVNLEEVAEGGIDSDELQAIKESLTTGITAGLMGVEGSNPDLLSQLESAIPVDDFILRPGEPVLKFNKDDLIVGGTSLEGTGIEPPLPPEPSMFGSFISSITSKLGEAVPKVPAPLEGVGNIYDLLKTKLEEVGPQITTSLNELNSSLPLDNSNSKVSNESLPQSNDELKQELQELKQIMSGFVEQMGQVVNRPITVELNGNKVGQALGQDSYRIQ